jgi:hypothetical protein
MSRPVYYAFVYLLSLLICGMMSAKQVSVKLGSQYVERRITSEHAAQCDSDALDRTQIYFYMMPRDASFNIL